MKRMRYDNMNNNMRHMNQMPIPVQTKRKEERLGNNNNNI